MGGEAGKGFRPGGSPCPSRDAPHGQGTSLSRSLHLSKQLSPQRRLLLQKEDKKKKKGRSAPKLDMREPKCWLWLCQSSSSILSWGSGGKWYSRRQEFPNPFSLFFHRRTPGAGRAGRAPRPPRAGAAHRVQAHRGAGKTRYGEPGPPHTHPPALPRSQRPKSSARAKPLPVLPSTRGQGGAARCYRSLPAPPGSGRGTWAQH